MCRSGGEARRDIHVHFYRHWVSTEGIRLLHKRLPWTPRLKSVGYSIYRPTEAIHIIFLNLFLLATRHKAKKKKRILYFNEEAPKSIILRTKF